MEKKRSWRRLATESFIVVGGVLLLTFILVFFPLTPRIPDGLLLYLLAILIFACVYGLYAALLASFVAFFAFDYFFVAPVYSLGAAKFEDVFTLTIFLLVAIISGQLASSLRIHALQARLREYETRTLYEFVRATNRESAMEQQLKIFLKAVVDVFSPGGIRDCALLLPDATGILRPLQSASQLLDQISFSSDEEIAAQWVIASARTLDLYDRKLPLSIVERVGPSGKKRKKTKTRPEYFIIRLVPLRTETQVLGVLRLLIKERAGRSVPGNTLGIELSSPAAQDVFFSTFLEQAVTVIGQARLREASVHLQVLQQTEALRSALFSSVSHDLRTPLATIKAAATTLLQDGARREQEAQQSVAITIEREVDRLDGLVENVLDISRIEGGGLRLEKVWYPLDELVGDAIDHRRTSLYGRDVRLAIPEALPPVELDPIQIEQVVSNLLENVIRYTPEQSPVDVSIHVEGRYLLVSIADRGPGIPAAERERIFDKFYRLPVEDGDAAYPRGIGLGLAICQGIITAHEGRIWVEPRDGGGAIFCFALPFNEIGEHMLDE